MSGYYQGAPGGFGGYGMAPPSGGGSGSGGGGSRGYPTAASSVPLASSAASRIQDLYNRVAHPEGAYQKQVSTLHNYTESLRQQSRFPDVNFSTWRSYCKGAYESVEDMCHRKFMRLIPEIPATDAETWRTVRDIAVALNETRDSVIGCQAEEPGFRERTTTGVSRSKK